MLRLGVIKESTGPWRSLPILVPKPIGTIRFCIDFRRLNVISSFKAHLMPWVNTLLDLMSEPLFLFTTDLTKGYW